MALKYLALALLALAALLGGLARYEAGGIPDTSTLAVYHGKAGIAVKGVIASDPEPRGQLIRFRLSVKEVRIGGQWTEAKGSVQVRAEATQDLIERRKPPYFRYGDLLLLRGELEQPSQSRDFDYRSYLARRGIGSVMLPASVELVGEGKGLALRERVYSLRHCLALSLEEALAEPQAALSKGIFLGLRSDIPKDVLDDFKETGTTHLLAISGLHIAIVGGLFVGLAAWLFGRGSRFAFFLVLALMWLYAVLTGFNPPVVRATIMVSLYLWAMHLGRQRSGGVALGVAAAVMAGYDPQLLWNTSFQMSFVAMMGLFHLTPRIHDYLSRTSPEWIRTSPFANAMMLMTSVSLGAIVATLPLIAFNFQRVSILGLPATMFALPALPFMIITSFSTALVGLVWSEAAQVMGWVAWLGPTYLEWMVRSFASVPLAAFSIEWFNQGFVWLYYALLATLLWLPGSLRRVLPQALGWLKDRGLASPPVDLPRLPFRWVAGMLFVTSVLVWTAAVLVPSDSRLQVLFLSGGNGEAIFDSLVKSHGRGHWKREIIGAGKVEERTLRSR